mgnify:CR=1 FL=1
MVVAADRHSLKGLMELKASELEKAVPSEPLRVKLLAAIEEGKSSSLKPSKNVGTGFGENLYRVMMLLVILTGKYPRA